MGLKYFKHRVYKDTIAVFNAIMDELLDIRKHIDDTVVNDDISGSSEQNYIPNVTEDSEDSTYNGYFKINLITNDDGTVQLSIEDGAYPGKEKDSFCYVNGTAYRVPACKIGSYSSGKDSETFIFLKFDVRSTPQLTIIESTRIDDHTSYTGYLLLGRVITSKDSIEIIQSEFSGIPMLFWFTNCAEMNSFTEGEGNE